VAAACQGIVRVLLGWQQQEKGRWRARPGVSGWQHFNTIGDGKGGRWRRWACRGVLGGATSTQQQGRRVAVGVLRHCSVVFFEVALAGRRRRGREGRGGTTRVAR
jgi:hypothetical protein